jgi:hypothetical protein
VKALREHTPTRGLSVGGATFSAFSPAEKTTSVSETSPATVTEARKTIQDDSSDFEISSDSENGSDSEDGREVELEESSLPTPFVSPLVSQFSNQNELFVTIGDDSRHPGLHVPNLLRLAKRTSTLISLTNWRYVVHQTVFCP